MITRRTCGSEDANRGTKLGERSESVDEFGLDVQYTPWIGVYPVIGSATLQQPLIRRRVRRSPITTYDRSLYPPMFGFGRQVTFSRQHER